MSIATNTIPLSEAKPGMWCRFTFDENVTDDNGHVALVKNVNIEGPLIALDADEQCNVFGYALRSMQKLLGSPISLAVNVKLHNIGLFPVLTRSLDHRFHETPRVRDVRVWQSRDDADEYYGRTRSREPIRVRAALAYVRAGDMLTIEHGSSTLMFKVAAIRPLPDGRRLVKGVGFTDDFTVGEEKSDTSWGFVRAYGCTPNDMPLPFGDGLYRDALGRIWLHAGDRWRIIRARNNEWVWPDTAHKPEWQDGWSDGDGIARECAPFTPLEFDENAGDR